MQQKIELNFPIKTNGENYDRARGEQIAEYTIERPDDDIGAAVADVTSQMFPSGTMDSFTLRSSRLPFKAHYMVGMVAVRTLTARFATFVTYGLQPTRTTSCTSHPFTVCHNFDQH